MTDRSSLRLRPHQQDNLEFFRMLGRAFSLLPYGAGKTPCTILRIGDLVPPRRALIVTTNGTVLKWVRDLKVWGDPEWVVVPLLGKRRVRLDLFSKPYNIAVINYEGLRVMIESAGMRFVKAHKVLVFDEIHRCKNHDADISKDAALISHPNHADYVYALTGSPVTETPLDLFSLMRIVNPHTFGNDFEAWRSRYFTLESEEKADGTKGFPKWVPLPGALDFLSSRLHSMAFRRERSQIQVKYPDQHFDDPIVVKLTGRTKSLYEQSEKKLALALRHQVIPLVNIYPRLEKLCQLSRGWCYDANSRPIYFPQHPALDAVGEYIEDVRGSGKVVIWAVRPPDMAMIAHLLDRMNRSYRIIYGGMRSQVKREAILNQFNSGYLDCLIANPRCIGEGLDLQANYSLRYSYRWSATEWDQPIGRFARMSSVADWVHYSDIVVADTVDMGIIRSVRSKLDIGEMVKKARDLPWRSGVAGGVFDGAA